MQRWWAMLRYRLGVWLQPRRRAQEAAEELERHVEMEAARRHGEGMGWEAAVRQARVALGGRGGLEEELGEVRGGAGLRELAQDTRHGWRLLWRSPGFTLAAVLTLGLAVGVNTAVFGMVDKLMLQPLPVANARRLAVLAFRQGNGPWLEPFSIADFRDIRAGTAGVFQTLVGYEFGLDGLSRPGGGQAGRVVSNYVTGNYFTGLGLRPALGRLLRPGEGRRPGADPVVVLSYDYWQSRFAGGRAVVGQAVRINGQRLTVVGVAPRGFRGLNAWVEPQIYLPIGMLTVEVFPPDFMERRILQNMLVAGAVKPNVSLEQAQAALAVVAGRLAAAYPASDRALELRAAWEMQARPDLDTAAALRRGGELFWGLVGLVLLLACANVGGILAVRGAARTQELAVRTALGAGRGRLLRQLMTENLWLALAGGVVGLGVAWAADRAAEAVSLQLGTGVAMVFPLDARVCIYALVVTLAAGVLTGLPPAWRAARRGPAAALPRGGQIAAGAGRWQTPLVVAQVAISMTLMVMAGLFGRSLWQAQKTPLGFDPQQVQMWTMDPGEMGATPAQGLAFYRALLDRVRAMPGVQSAALSASVPFGAYSSNDYLQIAGYSNPPGQGLPLVFYNVVSPGYFATLRVPLVAGRNFSRADSPATAAVAIVNQAFADKYWPGRNPLGQHFAKVSGSSNPSYTVVGMVANSRFQKMEGEMEPLFYLPLEQNYALSSQQTLQARSAVPAAALRREVEAAVGELNREVPVFDVEGMPEAMDSAGGWLRYRIGAGLAGLLAGLGLALTAVGLYGVIAQTADRRRREFAVRLALGAEPGQVVGMLLRQGLGMAAMGVACGVVGALAAGRLAAGLLHGVGGGDPLILAAVGGFVMATAGLAGYWPARRALRTDPAAALRGE